MGSPLSPVLADLFMEEFEQTALFSADLKPSVWIRYVDDTFVVWPHSPQDLQLFLQHLNSQHNDIQFTMEKEQHGRIAFLDVEVSRLPDGTLSRTVYRKPTHTDRYLNNWSFHHPSIKASVNRTLVRRAYNICDQDHLEPELHHISTALQRKNTGFTISDIWRPILNPS
ncbi:uncharacterized protein LOC110988853 [Acanthaster planci]|uniref:Uncharacterized protein LOC110988853 n=1 Tax=Acanthaster planci TaxID=133434 RepID=A0A8B7ZTQ1_ACAPL|nr:uncharacterized protein LOC110988853 [Acanthaster planci]